jgi:hypothetical protein
MDDLQTFIVAAKQSCYVGGGQLAPSTRQGSHDLTFAQGRYQYRDSYFGGTDFLGQETVWQDDEPIWAMNYYGRILKPDLIDGARAAEVIQSALSKMYAEGRFLGGFEALHGSYVYKDQSEGAFSQFTGLESIHCGDVLAYRLDYHGGMVVP